MDGSTDVRVGLVRVRAGIRGRIAFEDGSLPPRGPGGGRDLARADWSPGQTIVIDNRPGATGNIAYETVARAVPMATPLPQWPRVWQSIRSLSRCKIRSCHRLRSDYTGYLVPIFCRPSPVAAAVIRFIAPQKAAARARVRVRAMARRPPRARAVHADVGHRVNHVP
jgi:hypothetical protein